MGVTILLASLLPLAWAADPPPPPPAEEDVPGAVIEVWGDSQVQRARAELYQALRDEGYRKGVHRGEKTVFRSEVPWHPRVIVHDDGWVTLKREPPRLHSPGNSFTDEGSPASYLWCVIMPTACVSVGGWMVSPTKLGAAEAEVLDATHPYVVKLNEAVARREMARRVSTEIPSDLQRIWSLDLPADRRRVLLFEYWDSRNDDAAGNQARDAIEAFLYGVVQGTPDGFTSEEIAAFNTRRHCQRPFLSPPPAPPAGE